MKNALYAGLLALLACSETSVTSIPKIEGVYGALGEIMPHMAPAWQSAFEAGERVANHRFEVSEGLGPKFNVTSCTSCHESPTAGGGGPLYRNFLLIGQRTASDAFLLSGTRAGVYTFHHIDGLETESESRSSVNVTAVRNPIPFFGLGLISLISDDDILKNSDPNDANGDGISGRPNYIAGRIGRLGAKAQAIDIEGFVRGPLHNHLGITSDPLSSELKAKLPFSTVRSLTSSESLSTELQVARLAQVAAPNEPLTDDDGIPDPEITSEELFNLVTWATLLAAPEPELPTALSSEGFRHFENWGCAACHQPTLPSRLGAIPLYSDLLLHDMGDSLQDGIEMGFASGREFRTAPLWGVLATGPYLHDGRAATLDEAILMHGGEAARSARNYATAETSSQNALLEFLASLGGRSQKSQGLIDPNSQTPRSNELGGAFASLDETQHQLWTEGRLLFDRNFGYGEGLGPFFNGDSCRACHFLGAVGGAGPSDVDVHRLVNAEENTTTVRLQHNQHAALPTRITDDIPLEKRNTPPLFGLRILAEVPEAFLGTIADPNDADGDGIRGIVSITDRMTVGRFGWQAQVDSIDRFVREAFNDELGMKTSDVSDEPEVTNATIGRITAFLMGLSAPPTEDNAADIARFTEVGCADCHRTDLPIRDAPQPLTNLLLHDIGTGHFAPNHHRNRYRTPPLWALSHSAPYLHDGRAPTLRDAIEMHGEEAAISRAAFLALSSGEQEKLLAFLRSR